MPDLQSGISDASDIASGAGLSTLWPEEIISSAIDVALSLVGIIALAIIIYGGFLYITSAGDEEKSARGKKVIMYAVIGLVIIGLAAIIVNFVINFSTGGGATTSSSPKP